MQSFKVYFLRWCNNKNVVQTVEPKQKMGELYHNKSFDVLKHACTVQILTSICLHSSTSANFYPFTETDEDLLSQDLESMVGVPPKVFTRKIVVDKTHICKSTNGCESIARTDGS